jgi:hypothetical protein
VADQTNRGGHKAGAHGDQSEQHQGVRPGSGKPGSRDKAEDAARGQQGNAGGYNQNADEEEE